MKKENIHLRDPFILSDQQNRKYYLYGTTDPDCWKNPGIGFDAYVSDDLENWSGPIAAFRPEKDFAPTHNFWAPEVYAYKGSYYLFGSFKAPHACRGTWILKSDQPEGPFTPHSTGAVTPKDWECLDGTFFLDQTGSPWMVFCHEWVQVEDGEICAIPLREDLSAPSGSARILFRASDASWTVSPAGKREQYPHARVTDGPFLYRMKNGTLLMLWSSFFTFGYALGIARSRSGDIFGPWEQEASPLIEEDAGHGMIFRTFDGQLLLTVHTPNDSPSERPVFYEIEESGKTLKNKKRPPSRPL